MLVGPRGNFKRPISRLRDALLQGNYCLPLFVLIAQQRNRIVFDMDMQHLKLIGDLFDKVSLTLTR